MKVIDGSGGETPAETRRRGENETNESHFRAAAPLREIHVMNENEIGTIILAAAIEIHRELGPGLLESVYEVVLARELSMNRTMVSLISNDL